MFDISTISQNQNTEIKINVDDIKPLLVFIGSLCETKNEKSKNHIERMQKNTEILTKKIIEMYPEYQLSFSDCKLISLAATLHDIGKIKIASYILEKPTKLTAEEFSIVKKHPIYGVELIELFMDNKYENKFTKYTHDICLYHHERYDGKGYPNQLIGEEIPICAQIVGLIDVYDALLHEHVYRGAYDKKDTLNMIINGKCGQFNPKVIEAFKNSDLCKI